MSSTPISIPTHPFSRICEPTDHPGAGQDNTVSGRPRSGSSSSFDSVSSADTAVTSPPSTPPSTLSTKTYLSANWRENCRPGSASNPQYRPHPRRPARFTAGELLWLRHFDEKRVINKIPQDAYNHPALILTEGSRSDESSPTGEEVKDIEILICTTLRSTDLTSKYPNNPEVRAHYLPINSPHPDRPLSPVITHIGVDAPHAPKPEVTTYINAHNVFKVSSRDLNAIIGSGAGGVGRSYLDEEAMKEVRRWVHLEARNRKFTVHGRNSAHCVAVPRVEKVVDEEGFEVVQKKRRGSPVRCGVRMSWRRDFKRTAVAVF